MSLADLLAFVTCLFQMVFNPSLTQEVLTPITPILTLHAEIPLFHVMTASVTFGNINGRSNPAPHISLHMEQGRAEPVVVTTPTRGCRWKECGGVKHRGGSFVEDEEEGKGEEEGEKGNGDTTPRASG